MSLGHLDTQCRAGHMCEFGRYLLNSVSKGTQVEMTQTPNGAGVLGLWYKRGLALVPELKLTHVPCICCRLLERHRVWAQALLSALHQAAQRGHQVVQCHSKCDRHQGPHRHAHPAADSRHQGKGVPSSSQILTLGTSRHQH